MALVSNPMLLTCMGGVLLVGTLAAGGFEVAPPNPRLAREDQALKAVCAKCHNLQIVMDTPMSYDAWHDTVQKMVDRGANGTDEQYGDIMDYLHRTMTTINVNTADEDELEIVLDAPERAAQAIVARRRTKKFADLADLKSVAGIDAPTIDAKARLIFFK
jgi:competence protein ComEA